MSRPRTDYDDRGDEPAPRWEPLEELEARRSASIGCATVTVIVVLVVLLAAVAFVSCENDLRRLSHSGAGQVPSTPVPTLPLHGRPDGIVAGLDGALWSTDHDGSSIGRIASTGELSTVHLP